MKKIQDKPDEIKRVIRAGIKANRYIRANREVATATYDGVVKVYDDDINICEKGLRLVIEETKKTVKSSREMSFNDIVDLSILREAQREMGSK